MLTILLVLILLGALGGGGWAWSARGPYWGGGIIGLVLVVALIVWLAGGIGPVPFR